MKVIYESKLLTFAKKIRLMPKWVAAFTLFEWILTDRAFLTPELILHEQRHVWQYRVHLYIFFLPVYGLLALGTWAVTGNGYRDHPYERDARRYAILHKEKT